MKQDGVKDEIETYNSIIDNLKQSEIEELLEDGILPEKLLSLIDENFQTGTFKSKKWGIKLGTIYDIIDKCNESNFRRDTGWYTKSIQIISFSLSVNGSLKPIDLPYWSFPKRISIPLFSDVLTTYCFASGSDVPSFR